MVATSVVAGAIVLDRHGPPSAGPTVEGLRPSEPIASPRRAMEPLRLAAADRHLRDRLDGFVASQPADTCLEVEVGDVTYEHRDQDPQAPASVQKLATAIAALEVMGPEATYETEILSAPVVNGVVLGDLHVRGGGDPLLATADYVAREPTQPQIFSDVAALADGVVAAGVTAVAGSVVGDELRYDAVRHHPSWPARYVAQNQVGPLSALSVNDGFAYFPDRPGTFGAAADPAAYAAAVLEAALRDRGVEIRGPARSGATPAEAAPLTTHRSPTVSEIVVQMLRESDNNTAELVLKELGRRQGGRGTFTAGSTAVGATLQEIGFAAQEFEVVDGSGLSTENVLTCDGVVELLGYEPTAELVTAALPVAGETGTLARRWSGTDLAGRVRAKTGTLRSVTALAGHVDTIGGEQATFALLANVEPTEAIGDQTVAAQRELVEALASHPRLPDVEALRPDPPAPGD
jgi:serine-type D-Ala-D-Ala carboxypeptidase/endopeptidase (penicillin-binding protein 4)